MNQDFVKRYLEKSGDDDIIVKNYTENQHGFVSYSVEPPYIFIYAMYGDGKYWLAFLEEIARFSGCTILKAGTTRNPEAFARRFGAKLVGYIFEREVSP